MKVVKLLEKKEVIRVFGVGLLVAPLINSFLTMLAMPDPSHAWTLQKYFAIVVAGTMIQHVLDAASLVLGLVLLTGSSQAWKYILFLLGGYMMMQLANLGQNMRANPMNGLFFIANVGLFLFIADQLAFKQKAKPATPNREKQRTPQVIVGPTAPPSSAAGSSSPPLSHAVVPAAAIAQQNAVVPFRRSKAQILVDFQGVGPWAQVASISATGFELRSRGPVPSHIESREVELSLAPGLSLRARLKSRTGSLYFFEYTGLPAGGVQKLNQWLLAKAV
jgi:hypothetical protein